MVAATLEPTPDRPKRRPGRPRKSSYPPVPPPTDDEPPAKRRRFTRLTPNLKDLDDTVALASPRTDGLRSEGDYLDSILKSDSNGNDATFTPGPEENPVSPKTIRARTQSRSRRSYARPRPRGHHDVARPRYSSAAAAAAATVANDGYKPREERSWEEFHPDLDIDAALPVFTADEVDGNVKQEQRGSGLRQDTTEIEGASQPGGLGLVGMPADGAGVLAPPVQLIKRKPGRPPRRPESMLSGLGSPPAPRILPLPTHNPKERLNLPKPSFRHVQTFRAYEEDPKARAEDYVDKAMANVGYQESERFEIPLQHLIRHLETGNDDELGAGLVLVSDHKDSNHAPQIGDVEYDMDEQDERWLEAHNAQRKAEQVDPIRPAIFEITMTQIEREYYALEKRIPKPNPKHANQIRPRSSSAAAVNGEPWLGGDEPDSKCAICDDGDCENANAIIFCDGCDLAVHQECYGVPFIPEGQWFCRKCKEIGRGTPTCIFCPNIDGAFKQTNTLRWSHLLCAIWIPEVTIANPTYMEPVLDVDKVPRNRWSLVCYICNQRMGACIQCSNKACYQAFHVTCARRARLYLKMKATPTSGIDTTILKAFCDRHVPPEWRRDQDTDSAISNAKKYYRKTMKNRRWADSQSSALSMPSNEGTNVEPTIETEPSDDKSVSLGGIKRKKKDPAKTGWKLPSGAPVVPAVVFNTVETSLARFMLRKRKDFVAEACKYWTLKREARRGAALLKRLQLQLEGSSAMEITRRNFTGMGAVGGPRLQRRIGFAELLQKDIVGLALLVDNVFGREQKKLEDADNLGQLIDSLYFPIPALLWPILRKAQKLGEKSAIFEEGLAALEEKLADRYYTSVASFSSDIGALFAAIISKPDLEADEHKHKHDITELASQIVPMSWSERQALSADQKLQKSVAKRIIRAIKEPLEVALRNEVELRNDPSIEESSQWAKLDATLESCLGGFDQASATNGSLLDGEEQHTKTSVSAAAGASPTSTIRLSIDATSPVTDPAKQGPIQAPSPPFSAGSNPDAAAAPPDASPQPTTGPTAVSPLLGGVPWYMRPFSPVGTALHSPAAAPHSDDDEALSDVDEATLGVPPGDAPSTPAASTSSAKKRRRATPRTPRVEDRAVKRLTRGSVGGASTAAGARASRRRTAAAEDGEGGDEVELRGGRVRARR